MRIGGNFIILTVALSLSNYIFAESFPSIGSTSPLAKGTIVVAGPANTDEFYIIAENDEPKLKALLAEQANPSPPQPKAIPVRKKKMITKMAAAHKVRAVKKVRMAKQKTKIAKHVPAMLANKTMIVKKDLKMVRLHHKPSKMELALNNALEKAINKKQFKALKPSAQNKVPTKTHQPKVKIAAKKHSGKMTTTTTSTTITTAKIASTAAAKKVKIAKKTSAKRSAVKIAKKTTAKKAVKIARKTTAKKAVKIAKKTTAKKAMKIARKTAAKKAMKIAKKTTAKKAMKIAKKTTAKKAVKIAKKTTAKKAVKIAKKTTTKKAVKIAAKKVSGQRMAAKKSPILMPILAKKEIEQTLASK